MCFYKTSAYGGLSDKQAYIHPYISTGKLIDWNRDMTAIYNIIPDDKPAVI